MDVGLQIKTHEDKRAIRLTDKAIDKIAELIRDEGESDLALRVAVRPGGCSGFSYEMFFDSQFEDDDIIEEFGDVKVAVDPQSLPKIVGSVLDYKDGLMESGFAINNPNVERSCGCGNSFA